MKVGDKLICKKKFDKYENFFCLFQNSDSAFEVNKGYEIYDLDQNMIRIKCGFLVSSVHGIHEENTVFDIIKNEKNSPGPNTAPYLYDYFYTRQEIRKLKLNKVQRDDKFIKLGWKPKHE